MKKRILRRIGDFFERFAWLSIALTGLAFFAPYSCLADNFGHGRAQYFVLLLIGTGVWLKRRKKILAAVATATCLWNLSFLLPFYLPTPDQKDPSKPVLRILFLNVMIGNRTPDRVVDYLQRHPADLVVLQEVNDAWLEKLRPWSGTMAGKVECPAQDAFGICFYSRFHLIGSKLDPISDDTSPSIAACFDFAGQPFEALATHPLPPGHRETWLIRNRQFAAMAQWCRQGKGNRLIIGDLNVTPYSPFFRGLLDQGKLRDPRRGRGMIPSWPSIMPLLGIPIDTVLTQNKLCVVDIHRGTYLGSDHFPIWVILQQKSYDSERE
ncbi:MAG: endonuclease/exonuclease/phosphatase family protein [Verrucomicrobia bacterium]|nr:endonuclease/exonuclease/phosphatase family protein [Verrucomicrobiota bacterium]